MEQAGSAPLCGAAGNCPSKGRGHIPRTRQGAFWFYEPCSLQKA